MDPNADNNPGGPPAAPDDSAIDGQPEPDQDDMGGGMGDLCVPLSALSTPDEQDQMTNPEPGDRVTFTTEGTISRVEGGNAYVTPSAYNGQKVEQTQPQGSEEDQLRSQAAGLGSQQLPYS